MPENVRKTLFQDDFPVYPDLRRGRRGEAGAIEDIPGYDSGKTMEFRVGIEGFDKGVEAPEGKFEKARKENLSKKIRSEGRHLVRRLLSKRPRLGLARILRNSPEGNRGDRIGLIFEATLILSADGLDSMNLQRAWGVLQNVKGGEKRGGFSPDRRKLLDQHTFELR